MFKVNLWYMLHPLPCFRSLLFSEPWALRLNHLHHFLVRQLPAYAQDCSAIYPPRALSLKTDSTISAAVSSRLHM